MPYSVEGLLEINEVVEQITLVLEVFFNEDPAVKYLLHRTPASSEPRLLLRKQLLGLRLQAIQYDAKHHLAWVADEADGAVVLALPEVAFLGERNHKGLSPFCRPFLRVPDLLAEHCVRALTASSPPLLSSSEGTLSTPGDLPAGRLLTAASTSSFNTGGLSSLSAGDGLACSSEVSG